MKIDIALSGCQMIKRMAEDYRVQFERWFLEPLKKKKKIHTLSPYTCVCVYACVFYIPLRP